MIRHEELQTHLEEPEQFVIRVGLNYERASGRTLRHFSTPIYIDNTWELGDYDVQGIYFGKLVGASQFTITQK